MPHLHNNSWEGKILLCLLQKTMSDNESSSVCYLVLQTFITCVL